MNENKIIKTLTTYLTDPINKDNPIEKTNILYAITAIRCLELTLLKANIPTSHYSIGTYKENAVCIEITKYHQWIIYSAKNHKQNNNLVGTITPGNTMTICQELINRTVHGINQLTNIKQSFEICLHDTFKAIQQIHPIN